MITLELYGPQAFLHESQGFGVARGRDGEENREN